ncbi:MAG: hypothetical protein ACLPPF_02430 [Rhodomicrobium sp.]
MHPATSRLCRIAIPAALALSLPCCPPAALAGGGYSEPGLVQQSQSGSAASYSPRGYSGSADSVTVTASGDGFSVTSTTGAEAGAGGLSSVATVWSATTVQTGGLVGETVSSASLTETFTKGAASLSLGTSTTEASIIINGKTYVVAQELAIAFARATQFGASSYVEVEGILSLPGGVSPPVPVAANKSGGR